MKYSFIVPFLNGWNLTLSRLNEFRKYLPDNCEIVLVDDASTEDGVKQGIAFWQKSGVSRHSILYKRNEENKGFSGSMNVGAKIATGDVFIFYSNDVILSGNIVDELERIYENTDGKVLIGDQLLWWDTGWNKFEIDGKPIIVPYLGGYFISCKRESWKELGWDEDFIKFDYEDVSLSFKATIKGYELIPLNSKLLRHLSGQTISKITSNREEITKRNRIIFIEKWIDELRKL